VQLPPLRAPIPNSFGLRAYAQRLIELTAVGDLPSLASALTNQRFMVIGGGTNLLIRNDFDGTVIVNRLTGITQERRPTNQWLITCAAGESWGNLVDVTVAAGLWGLENLSLIPGSVGASPIQNIGAYGVEMCDTFYGLTAFNLKTSATKFFEKSECQFAYRDSIFKKPDMKHWLITQVSFLLKQEPSPRLGYGDLRDTAQEIAVSAGRIEPSLLDIANAVKNIRKSKLPDPAVIGNAGSFFKNPIIKAATCAALKDRFPTLPIYDVAGDLSVKKTSAGWLIDQCGWKGFRQGDVGVHKDHALVLVNYGSATGEDIWQLAQTIQASVAQQFGLNLEPEPTLM
jgi:UDP-N-acetylmuramate dehydrogenase